MVKELVYAGSFDKSRYTMSFKPCVFLIRHYIFLCILGITVQTNAQTTFFGTVMDVQNQPLSFASISVIHPLQQSIIAYTMTDEQGKYQLTFSSDSESVNIQFRLFDYQSIQKVVKNTTQQIDFIATTEVTVLEEILIRPTPITQDKDILSYNISTFAYQSDRVLADVLPKIPGLEVSDQGRIKYQGKEINRFYIEGKDLMGGSYHNLTTALPTKAISKLEIIENHQPIKMLDGTVFSENAGINIKLKNNTTITGIGKMGIGASPLLWNTKIAPILFHSKIQTFINYESNNNGIDLSHLQSDFSFSTSFEGFVQEHQGGITLQLAEVLPPTINSKRYLNNTSHLASVHGLTNLNEHTTLRINAHYYNNTLENQGEALTVIRNNSDIQSIEKMDSITYYRKNHSHLFEENIKAQATIAKNTSTSYLNNRTMVQINRNKQRGILDSNAKDIQQQLQSPSYSIQNSLSTLIPLTSKKFLTIKSLVNWTQDKQDYEVNPSSNLVLADSSLTHFNSLHQAYIHQNISTKNQIFMSWQVRNILLTGEVGMNITNHKLQTNLYGQTEEMVPLNATFQNHLNYFDLAGSSAIRLNYKGRKWNFDIYLPLLAYAVNLKDRNTDQTQTLHKTTVEPSLSLQYKVNSFWQLNGNAKVHTTFIPLNQLHANPIFSGLNFSSFESALSSNTHKDTGLKLSYKNPLYSLFGYMQFNYNIIDRSTLLSTEIASNGQQITRFITQDNQVIHQNAQLIIQRFFSKLNLNTSLQFGASNTKNSAQINGKTIAVSNQRYTIGLDLSNNSLDWMSARYKIDYSQDIQTITNLSRKYNLSQQLELDIYLFENHSFRSSMDYQQDYLERQSFNNQFIDLMYRYTWSKKKIDFEIQWTNILNTKEYQQVLFTDWQINTTTFRLNPSQILLAVRFNFN